MAIQATFDLDPRGASEWVREEREDYGDRLRPKIFQIGPVVQALEQFSRMQSEPKQALAHYSRTTSAAIKILLEGYLL